MQLLAINDKLRTILQDVKLNSNKMMNENIHLKYKQKVRKQKKRIEWISSPVSLKFDSHNIDVCFEKKEKSLKVEERRKRRKEGGRKRERKKQFVPVAKRRVL